jgi:CelD/BcsL family acetyltransferase involved in cellulose biosynthesis
MVDQFLSRINQRFETEVISNREELDSLTKEWDRITGNGDFTSPFVGPDWLVTWWECFGHGQELRVLVLRSGGGIRGIVPLSLGVSSFYGIGARRLGIPFNDHIPRCDLLVPDHSREAYEAMWRYISACRHQWDVAEFPQLPADGDGLERMRECLHRSGCKTGEWQGAASPFLPIEGSWSRYFQALPAKRRANLRNRRRRLARYGDVEFEIVSSQKDLKQALVDGYRIEAAAWKGARGTAIQSSPEVRQFYTRLAYRMARRGALRLCFLRIASHRVAFAYMLEVQDKIYLLKQGYDPDYAQFSPAIQLIVETLQYAFSSNLKEYDFLGADERWKFEWTSHVRPHTWLYAFSSTARAQAMHALKFRALPWIKGVSSYASHRVIR